MPHYTVTVGNVEMISLHDGISARNPLDAFPDTTIEQWREVPGILDEHDQTTSRMGTTAVRSGGKLIVVDTGLQLPGAPLMDELKAKGVDRDAVDLVVFTHLHPDHVGWNLIDGKPTFPNARYLAPRQDWDFWSKPSVLEKSAFIGSQVVPIDEINMLDLMDDGYNITDEMTAVLTPGHTPGHMSFAIASNGERGYILGDVAGNPIQAYFTDWCATYDQDPDAARATRYKVLDGLEADGSIVSAGHFPDPGFGKFVRIEGKRYWQGL